MTNDSQIEPQYREQMNALARALDEIFNGDERPGKVGFFLGMFEFGDNPGRFNYISNAERRDMVTLLKEMVARFEGQPEMKGRA